MKCDTEKNPLHFVLMVYSQNAKHPLQIEKFSTDTVKGYVEYVFLYFNVVSKRGTSGRFSFLLFGVCLKDFLFAKFN